MLTDSQREAITALLRRNQPVDIEQIPRRGTALAIVNGGTSIAVDPQLNTYLAGDTTSTNLVSFNPLQGTLTPGATRNAFVVKLGTATNLCITCVPPVIFARATI